MKILRRLVDKRAGELEAKLGAEKDRQVKVYERAKVRQRLLQVDLLEREIRLMAPLEAERLANAATLQASRPHNRRVDD